jgi:hypothetical protein
MSKRSSRRPTQPSRVMPLAAYVIGIAATIAVIGALLLFN